MSEVRDYLYRLNGKRFGSGSSMRSKEEHNSAGKNHPVMLLQFKKHFVFSPNKHNSICITYLEVLHVSAWYIDHYQALQYIKT
jgi:hypothetical protein